MENTLKGELNHESTRIYTNGEGFCHEGHEEHEGKRNGRAGYQGMGTTLRSLVTTVPRGDAIPVRSADEACWACAILLWASIAKMIHCVESVPRSGTVCKGFDL